MVDGRVAFRGACPALTGRVVSVSKILLSKTRCGSTAGVLLTRLNVILCSVEMRILRCRHRAQQLHLLSALLVLRFAGACTLTGPIIHLGNRLRARLIGGVGSATARIVIVIISCRLEAAEAIRYQTAEAGQTTLTPCSVGVTIHLMHLAQADALAGRYVGHSLRCYVRIVVRASLSVDGCGGLLLDCHLALHLLGHSL